MEGEAANPLFELSNDDSATAAPQKDLNKDATNPLYDLMHTEGTNGHGEDIVVNGDSGDHNIMDQNQNDEPAVKQVDLLQDADLLGGGESAGITMEPAQVEPEKVPADSTGDLLGDSGDLLGGDSAPITSDDSGVLVEETNTSTTEVQEPEQPREETAETPVETEDQGDKADAKPEEVREPTEPETSEAQDAPVETSDELVETKEAEAADDEGTNVDDVVDTKDESKVAEAKEVEQSLEAEAKEVEAQSESTDAQTKETDVVEESQATVPEPEAAPVEQPVEQTVSEPVESPAVSADVPDTVEDAPEVAAEDKKVEEAPVPEPEAAEPEQVIEPETPPVAEEAEQKVDAEEAETVPEPEASVDEKQVEPEVTEAPSEPEHVVEESAPAQQEQVASVEEPVQEAQAAPEVETISETEQAPEPVVQEEAAPVPAIVEEPVQEAPKEPEVIVQEEAPSVATEEAPQEPETQAVEAETIPEPEAAPEAEPEPVAETSEPVADTPETLDIGDDASKTSAGKTEPAVADTRNSTSDENAQKLNGASEVKENGVDPEDAVRDPDIFRETREKEEVHFKEMNNVRQKFESGEATSVPDGATPKTISIKEEYDQGGEFESQPVENPDVVKETDQPIEELPEVGMAKNLLDRFKSIADEKAQPVTSAKRQSPPRGSEKVEYENEPEARQELQESKAEAGVFESQPAESEDVIRAGDTVEDVQPEKGATKNIMNKFKELESEQAKQKSGDKQREITPDRSGKVEYVSEPRGESIKYEDTKTESGVFENVPKQEEDVVRAEDRAEEVMPESGMAKNLLSKFKQLESEVSNRPPPSPGRQIDMHADKSAKVEFSNEPKGFLEKYEPQTESGEYENHPEHRPEVVRSEDTADDVLPEAGSAKKTMERFKEIQKQSNSPVNKQSAKEFTPPREGSPGRTVSGVVESTPEERPDVVKSGEVVEEELPEQGTTKNMLNRFKEMATSGSQSSSPGRKNKEFTPPPESGVYENKPQEHLVIESRESESGVLESTPSKSTADVAQQRDSMSPEAELPEQGMAKNLVSKWKQIETTSAKGTASASPRFKEFTPPRESRGPMSPKSPAPDSEATNGVHLSDLPGQYQPQAPPSLYENNPEKRTGVFREADNDWEKDLPAANTTSSMLQKFKSLQQKAKDDQTTPEPVSRKGKNVQHE